MNWRFYNIFCLATVAFSVQAFAQNQIPTLGNVTFNADTANHVVTVQYDLGDLDGDDAEVWIQVSADSGRTWRVAIDSLSGDHGFPISPGTGRQLQWHYLPSTLTQFGTGLAAIQVRLIADDRQAMDLQAVTDLVDSARIVQQLYDFEKIRHRTANLQNLNDTKDSLEAFLNMQGLHPYKQGGQYGQYHTENVIGRRSGTRNDSACWQISGHFDTVDDAPGGDDNATAVVCVSEAVRVLSQFQTKESLRFFYFDLEEAGLIGSAQYIQTGLPDWESPMGLLNMDCVGYYSDAPNSQVMPFGFNFLFPDAYAEVEADSFRGNFLTSVVNTSSSWMDTVFRSTAANHVPSLKVITLETAGTGLTTIDLRRSDHAPFWDAGYPAIFFTDGANFRNPNYHTPNDSVHYIDKAFYVKNVRAIVTTLARLAKLEHSTVTTAGSFEVLIPVGLTSPVATPSPTITVIPTPSHGKVELRYSLPFAGTTRMEVMDHHGRLLQVLQNGWLESGTGKLHYQCGLPAGQYAVVLRTEQGHTAYHPLIILH